jgi:hypothetical protein
MDIIGADFSAAEVRNSLLAKSKREKSRAAKKAALHGIILLLLLYFTVGVVNIAAVGTGRKVPYHSAIMYPWKVVMDIIYPNNHHANSDNAVCKK